MRKHLINDAPSLKEYLNKIDNPIFGIGTRPYNFTIGVYGIFKYFEILACSKIGLERPLIEKSIKTTYLNQSEDVPRSISNYENYETKKPIELLKNETIVKYLTSFKKKPILLFNQMPKDLEMLLKNKPYHVISSGYRMFKKYENKINFQNLLDELNITSPKHFVLSAKKLNYAYIEKRIGKKFVIQLPSTALGTGTFFIFKNSDLEKIIKKEALRMAIKHGIDLRITEYIDKSCSPSMTVCVSKFGVLYTGLQRQIIDAKEVLGRGRRSGVYCGHDWSLAGIDPTIESTAAKIAQKIGSYFKNKEKFRGIFGIDFILDKKTNQLYPIEANIRLLGSFPVLSMIQDDAEHPPIQGLQIIDGLNKNDYELDVKSLNKLMSEPKAGSHLNIYSKNKDSRYVSGVIAPGVYSVDVYRKKITYLRKGLFFADLKNKNEVLFTGGVPQKGRVFSQHNNMCKIISRNSFLGDDDKLNGFAKLMVHYVYKKLALKKVPPKVNLSTH